MALAAVLPLRRRRPHGPRGLLPRRPGATVEKAIKRLAGRLPDTSEHEDWPEGLEPDPEARLQQRLADALWALCSNGISTDQDPDRATVVVHVEAGAVAGVTGEIAGGPALHRTTCERLACDARLQFVLTDRAGDALGIGRVSQAPPAWLERQVRYRDHYCCTFPGCNQRAFLQSHHVRHWLHHGPTELGDLTTTCFFHHKLLHEYGWSVELKGSVTHWIRPNGTRYEPGRGPPVMAA